jgi:hypothetical protein
VMFWTCGHYFILIVEAMFQRNLTFNPLWVFEFLLQHLEHEELEIYESWIEQIIMQIEHHVVK